MDGNDHGLIGTSVPRKEDPRLLTGAGRYVDDLHEPGMLYLAVLRSPHAHARLRSVDVCPALACPGVVAVVTGQTVFERIGPLPTAAWKRPEAELHADLDPIIRYETHQLVAVDKARYAGQAVALVLADSRYLAEDAAELVAVD